VGVLACSIEVGIQSPSKKCNAGDGAWLQQHRRHNPKGEGMHVHSLFAITLAYLGHCNGAVAK
jgi:hypothetical protein